MPLQATGGVSRRLHYLPRKTDELVAWKEWLDREMATRRLGLLDLMVCEVLQGVRTDAQAAAVLAGLRRFEIFDTAGLDLAVAAAANYRTLRARGRTVRRTVDRDFDAFEDHLHLQVIAVPAT